MHKDIHDKGFYQSTITKLDIFEKYLEAWLPVFIQSPVYNNVLICDFFAGPGTDAVGNPGSPLRILQTIEEFRDQIVEKKTRIRIILNDQSRQKADKLKSLVTSRTDQIRQRFEDLVSLECRCDDFLRLFKELYSDFHDQPNLIFIDQYGIKQVDNAVFQQLVALDATDFLFFISSSYFRRFAKEPSFASYFPDLDSDQLGKARYEDVHRIVLDYYRRKVPAENATRLYPFSLKKDSNIYGLIFGSKHPLGVEKFLNIAWDRSKLNGEANFDIDQDIAKRQLPLFNDEPIVQRLTKVELFEREVEEFILRRREVTNCDIYDLTLARGHAPGQGRCAIIKLRKAGKIEYVGQIGCSYNSCYRDRNIKIIKAAGDG